MSNVIDLATSEGEEFKTPVILTFGTYKPGTKYAGIVNWGGYIFGKQGFEPPLALEIGAYSTGIPSGQSVVHIEFATESTDAVALFSTAQSLKGGEVWGANLIGEVGYSNAKCTGLEIDFGIRTNAQRAEPLYNPLAYGLTIQYFSRGYQGVNPFPYIQIGLKKHTAKVTKFKGKLTEGSTKITGVVVEEGTTKDTIAQMAPGQELSGSGIPPKATITEINAAEATITMSAGATTSGEESLSSTEIPLVVAFEAETKEGSATLSKVSTFVNLSPGLEVVGTGIPTGTVISSVDAEAKTVALSVNATASGTVKLEAKGQENMGCLYGIRFLGEETGARLISPEGTAIDFHNLGGCKYGIDFETNVFAGAAIHFGAGTSRQFAWTSAEPTVTGSKGGNEALKSLLEKACRNRTHQE